MTESKSAVALGPELGEQRGTRELLRVVEMSYPDNGNGYTVIYNDPNLLIFTLRFVTHIKYTSTKLG